MGTFGLDVADVGNGGRLRMSCVSPGMNRVTTFGMRWAFCGSEIRERNESGNEEVDLYPDPVWRWGIRQDMKNNIPYFLLNRSA